MADNGYIKNCIIKTRNFECLFDCDAYGCKIYLDGYAIVPIEDYVEKADYDALKDFYFSVLNEKKPELS